MQAGVVAISPWWATTATTSVELTIELVSQAKLVNGIPVKVDHQAE